MHFERKKQGINRTCTYHQILCDFLDMQQTEGNLIAEDTLHISNYICGSDEIVMSFALGATQTTENA